ncbi:hypothetical protein [Kangiella spongicola]|uniref:Uncharacterized protein n=1 Tax=Kangiella spongicola TaxID=796379 RepID=A0A318DBA2_9GAMM|nr:hypothetical protein [Kangiella spongicola]PXF64227.1 hypothetical protein DL796_03575 [Kangiella spongicola]
MPFNATDRTLGQKSIWQVYRKLCWEAELFNEVPDYITTSIEYQSSLYAHDSKIYCSINCASTSLSLVDWLFHTLSECEESKNIALKSFTDSNLSNDKDFLFDLRKKYPVINLSHQICNANKHYYLRKNSIDENVRVMVGDIIELNEDGSQNIRPAINVSQTSNSVVQYNCPINEFILDLVNFWGVTLDSLKIPDKNIFFSG